MDNKDNKVNSAIKVGVGICLILLLAVNSFVIVGGGERGVLFSRASGVQDTVLGEGFHLKVPFIDKVIIYEVRTTRFELVTESSSSDQQIVSTQVVLNYHLNPETVNKLYQQVGTDYVNRIIKPALEDSVKSSMAKFKAEELIQKRAEVSYAISEDVRTKLDKNILFVVDGLSLTNLDFSAVYNSAIEAKVTAEQKAFQAKNDLERIKIEAEQTVVRAQAEKEKLILEAQGEAESLRIKQEAVKDSEDVIALKWIETWDGVLPTYYGGGDENLLLSMNSAGGMSNGN